MIELLKNTKHSVFLLKYKQKQNQEEEDNEI